AYARSWQEGRVSVTENVRYDCRWVGDAPSTRSERACDPPIGGRSAFGIGMRVARCNPPPSDGRACRGRSRRRGINRRIPSESVGLREAECRPFDDWREYPAPGYSSRRDVTDRIDAAFDLLECHR